LQVSQRCYSIKENDTLVFVQVVQSCLGMLSSLQGIAFNLLKQKEFHKFKLLARWNFLINFLVFGIKHDNKKGSLRVNPINIS
jgi:hypothetical protein